MISSTTWTLRTAVVTGAALLALPASVGAAENRTVTRDTATPSASPDTTVHRTLTLERAVSEAVGQNPELRHSRLRQRAAEAGVQRATGGLLPRLQVTSGWRRTTDPVGAFGTKLRQGRFGGEDLAVEALDDPSPVTDWTSAAEVRWSAVDPARWAERSAASSRAAAARWRADRSREATAFRARALYWEAARAGAELDAARAAEEAARSNVELFRRRHEEGMLTDAHVLRAEAELDAARASRVDARRRLRDARERLGLFLGWSPDSVPVPADSLGEPAAPEAGTGFVPERRSDLRALEAGVRAARSLEDAAWRRYLPAVDAFGRWALHDADHPLGADGDDWSVGVQIRWTVFAGLGREAARRQADLAAQEARLEYSTAVREASAQARRARRAADAARQRVEATRSARRAAERGRDLTRRRFEEGLAIAADVLQAESRVATMRSRAIEALAAYRIAVARLRFARSQDHDSPGEAR